MTRILITGAGSGLNNGAALELARRGHDVIAGVENFPQLRALELQSKQAGVNLRIEKIDVTKEGDRRRAATFDVDVLVNGAGIIEGGAIIDIPEENLRRQLDVNVIGPTLLTQEIARKMVERRKGKIILVSWWLASLMDRLSALMRRRNTRSRQSPKPWRWSFRNSAWKLPSSTRARASPVSTMRRSLRRKFGMTIRRAAYSITTSSHFPSSSSSHR